MDGRRIGRFSRTHTLLAAAAIVAGLIAPASGQAMLKLNLGEGQSTTVAAESAPAPAAVAPAAQPEEKPQTPATPPAGSAVAPAAPIINMSQIPWLNTPGLTLGGASPLAATPAIQIPVGGTTSAIPETPAASVTPSQATAPPADAAGSARVEPRPIEKTLIRGNDPAKSDTPGATNANKSNFLTGMGNTGQVIAALAVVIGLIFIGRALARKFIPGAAASNGKGVVEILARHPLSKNQSIVLLRIGSQIVALNQGKDASQSVLVINEPTEVARIIGQIEGKNPNSISAGFNKLLSNARVDLEQEGDVDLRDNSSESLDDQLEEMAAAKRQLMELRQHVRSVRDSIPRA